MRRGVIGLGNPLRGDDGIVMVLFDHLRERDLPADVDLQELGDAGFTLVHALADFDRVLVVDAVHFGGDPGDHAVFTPADVASVQSSGGSHDSDVFELVDLADQIDERPERVVIFGIQPAETGFSEGLSDPLQAAVPTLADALVDAIESL
jgi:hydrogenase maturation protease